MRPARRLAVALLMGVAILAATAAAPAQAKQPLRLQFHRVVTGVDGHCGHAVVTSGPYVLVSLSAPVSQGCPTRFLLIDDATGQRRVLRPGGFSYVLAFGAPLILFPLVCGAGCVPEETVAYAIGARWLEFIVEGHQRCSDGIHFACGPDTYAYYNLRPRKVRHGSPQTRSRIVDLDSPTLVRKLCKPLKVPSGGSLLLEGQFAVLTEQNGTSFLERCGSHLRMPTGMQPESVANVA